MKGGTGIRGKNGSTEKDNCQQYNKSFQMDELKIRSWSYTNS